MAAQTLPTSATYDAIVIGARCAGAATAMLLAQRGLRVLVADAGQYGSDTVSTHALMRGGVLQLYRWNLLPAVTAAGTPPVQSTTFHYGDEALTIPIKPRDGVDALFAPRRSVLDRILVDAAAAAGAEILHRTRLTSLLHLPDGRVSGVVLQDERGAAHRLNATVVVGADGGRSAVARFARAREYHRGRFTSAIVYAHWSGVDVEGYHWYFRPGVSAGAIPTNAGETCVFVATPAGQFQHALRGGVAAGYGRLLAEAAPDLGRMVRAARRGGSFHGFAGQVGYFRQSWGPGWALVGDAGYFKDPLTAHGITDALRDAELLADALVTGSEEALAGYQHARDEFARELFDVTDAIASFEWDLPAVRTLHERLVKAMAREVKAMLGRVGSALKMGA